MSEGALRGTRLGAASYETDENVVLAPRSDVYYDCPNGHTLSMPFSVAAEVPATWDCHCGARAALRDGVTPELKPMKHVRTHWDMLRERRSIDELEILLAERLEIIQGTAYSEERKSA